MIGPILGQPTGLWKSHACAMCVRRRPSSASGASAPTSIATHAAPFMKGYWAGASQTSVHTHTAHRPSHASLSTQLVHASSDAVPP